MGYHAATRVVFHHQLRPGEPATDTYHLRTTVLSSFTTQLSAARHSCTGAVPLA